MKKIDWKEFSYKADMFVLRAIAVICGVLAILMIAAHVIEFLKH